MNKLEELARLCDASVIVSFNEHTANYQTLEEYLYDSFGRKRFSHLSEDEKIAIISAGTIVEVQAYPKTPVGFILSVHHDLDKAVEQAIKWAKEY